MRCVAGVRALCGRSAGSAIPRRHSRTTATSLHQGHAVQWEHMELVLLLSLGRDNLVVWGKEEALLWAPYSTAVCSDLCSSSVIHSFSHQLKIPVV